MRVEAVTLAADQLCREADKFPFSVRQLPTAEFYFANFTSQ